MRRRRRLSAARLALFACSVAVATAGCGGGDATTSTTTQSTTTVKETREPLPEHPREWSHYTNDRGGFAVLLPRGWKAEGEGPSALIRSYDRLVALSITPDRAPAAQQIDLGDSATRTAAALNGYRGEPELGPARPFGHRYDGARVNGRATSKDGIAQRLSVIVLRRDGTATFTIVLAANAKPAARESARLAARVISTLRSRPPRPPTGDPRKP